MHRPASPSPSGAPDGSYAELVRLAGPVMLSRLGIMAMGLTDAIVVGQWSARELGIHAMAWAPTGTVLVGGIGLLMGVQVLTARHIGAGSPERTGAVLRRGVVYAFWIGIVSTIALELMGPWLLGAIGIEPGILERTALVLRIFALSLTPYLVADALIFWFEAQGEPKKPMVALWLANGVNVALALWLVRGGIPGIDGALGVACATLGARVFLMLVLVWMLWRWPRTAALGVWTKPAPDRAEARAQRRIGYASGASYLIEGGAFSALTLVAGQISVLTAAAWAVVGNVAALVFMVPLGLATATAVLVARAAGAGSVEGVKRAFSMGMKLSMGLLLLISVGLWAGAGLVARAYTADPAVLVILPAALGIAALFYMADGAQVVAANALRARGDIWWPTGMHLVSYALLMLPLCWWLAVPAGLGLNGIVWGVTVASFVSAGALVARFGWLGDRMKAGVH